MTDRLHPVIFGEVLFDCFPDGQQVLGGAPFNVAWHLQGFGLTPLMISAIGDDAAGRQVLTSMQDWGMRTEGVQIDPRHPTGRVSISLSQGEPHYDIVDSCAYDVIQSEKLPDLPEYALLYHGTLAVRNLVSAQSLKQMMEKHKCSRFVDVNLRAPWWKRQSVLDLCAGATWAKLNHDELTALSLNASVLLDTIQAHGFLLVTKGEQGAVLHQSGNPTKQILPEQQLNVVDTVGAGDAFSSVMILGIIKQWPLDLAMARAQAFASSVVAIRGAISHDTAFYAKFTTEWGA